MAEVKESLRIYLNETGSTNSYLKLLALRSEATRLAVFTNIQTEGRGSHGKLWSSPIGGLYGSFLIHIPHLVESSFHLGCASLAASLAVAEFLEDQLKGSANISLKWPNDVLVNGKKVCGILCEALPDNRLILGIGLNLQVSLEVLQPFKQKAFSATSIHLECPDLVLDPRSWGRNLDEKLRQSWGLWEKDGMKGLIARWEAKCFHLHKKIRFLEPTSSLLIDGYSLGLSERGGLWLSSKPGERVEWLSGHILQLLEA